MDSFEPKSVYRRIFAEVTINYHLAPRLARQPYLVSACLADQFPERIWTGGKTGQVMVRGFYVFASPSSMCLTSDEARQLVRGNGCEPCVPAEIYPFLSQAEGIVREGICNIVALDRSDDVLFRNGCLAQRGSCVVVADLMKEVMRVISTEVPNYGDGATGTEPYRFTGSDWFAGIPRVDHVSASSSRLGRG